MPYDIYSKAASLSASMFLTVGLAMGVQPGENVKYGGTTFNGKYDAFSLSDSSGETIFMMWFDANDLKPSVIVGVEDELPVDATFTGEIDGERHFIVTENGMLTQRLYISADGANRSIVIA